jgi:hypothetical protein
LPTVKLRGYLQQAEAIINHVSERLAKPDDVPITVLLIVGVAGKVSMFVKLISVALFFGYFC